MKILIAEDQSITAQGFQSLLEELSFDVHLVMDGEMLLKTASSQNFDLILADYALPKKNGLESLISIKQSKPNQKCILISSLEEERIKQVCESSGIESYLFKSQPKELILSVIQKVILGERFFSTPSVRNTNEYLWNHPANPFLRLTDKEINVLKDMLNHISMKDTAKKQGVSVKTIDSHRNNIRRKLKMDQDLIFQEAKKWGMI
jgi:DNA-binding NarL/FixJ family response regulator